MLRSISSKAELGLEEEEEMTRRGAAEGLKFNVSAKQIARVSGARRSSPAWRGKRTTPEIRFVMGRGHFEICITANPVVREKSPRFFCGRRRVAGRDRGRLRF